MVVQFPRQKYCVMMLRTDPSFPISRLCQSEGTNVFVGYTLNSSLRVCSGFCFAAVIVFCCQIVFWNGYRNTQAYRRIPALNEAVMCNLVFSEPTRRST